MIFTENISSIQALKPCLALQGKYLEPRVLHPNESMYSNLQNMQAISATYHRLEYIASFYAVQYLGAGMASYIHYVSFGSKLYMLEHGLRTPRERAFFSKILNCLAWADKIGLIFVKAFGVFSAKLSALVWHCESLVYLSGSFSFKKLFCPGLTHINPK